MAQRYGRPPKRSGAAGLVRQVTPSQSDDPSWIDDNASTDQLAVLDDVDLTGTDKSSADALGVSGTILATKLTAHLVREIVSRGTWSSALTTLANQIGHEVTQLKVQQIDYKLDQLVRVVDEEWTRSRTTRRTRPVDSHPIADEVGEASERSKEYGTNFVENELPAIARQMISISAASRPVVVFIDIDDLTRINARFGRAIGDSVLDVIYTIICKHSRSRMPYKGRCGDDTFFAVLWEGNMGQGFCTKVRNDVRKYNWWQITPDLYVTCTLGYATLSPGEEPYKWVTRAILAMKPELGHLVRT